MLTMNKHTVTVTASVVLALFAAAGELTLPGLAATPDGAHSDAGALQAAINLYNQKQYNQAVAAFLKLTQSQPRNTTAALYLGHCYYALGRATSAAQYYRWIADNFPASAEAASAKQMLSRLGGDATSTATVTDKSGASSRAAGAAGEANVNSMISVVKPLGSHPACTPEFIKNVKESVEKFPKGLLKYMQQQGCKICITPSLIDRNPELRNTRPRGYEDGNTYKNTPAMFDSPEVVVCQYAQRGENEDDVYVMDDSVGALRHEFGHAMDHFMGNLSYTEEFRHIYYLDRGRVDADYKTELNYFIQPGTEEGGPSECFAEACCIALGGNKGNTHKEKRDQHFSQSFPNVIKFVQAKIDQTK
jgi:tetratricopeptide (TPR) repeat protein